MVKNLPASAEDAGDTDSIPGSERSPGVGCVSLADSMDRGAWWATQQSMALQSVGDRQTDTHTPVKLQRVGKGDTHAWVW